MKHSLRFLALGALLLGLGCSGADEAAVEESANVEEGGATGGDAPTANPTPTRATYQLAEIDTVIRREVFEYTPGARDPFSSLLTTVTSGPELVDLDLVAVYYMEDEPVRSAAVLRERVSGRRHTVRQGQRLGRMQVAQITPKDVWFVFDDFGVQRRESLTLRKQEVAIP